MGHPKAEFEPGSLADLTQQYRAAIGEQMQEMNSVGSELHENVKNIKSPDIRDYIQQGCYRSSIHPHHPEVEPLERI